MAAGSRSAGKSGGGRVLVCAILAARLLDVEADGHAMHHPLKGALTVCIHEAKGLATRVDASDRAAPAPHVALVDVGEHQCRLESEPSPLHPTWSTCCFFGVVSAFQDVGVRVLERGVFVETLLGRAALRASETGTRWTPLLSHGAERGAVKVDVRFVPSGSDALSLRMLSAYAGRAASNESALKLKPLFAEHIFEYALFVDASVDTITLVATPAAHCYADRHTGVRRCEQPRVTAQPHGAPSAGGGVTVPLRLGRNTIQLLLTAEHSSVVAPAGAGAYVLHVHREAADDAALKALYIDGIAFSEPFQPSRADYFANVPHAVSAVAVHAQTHSAFATINGLVAHGAPSSNAWALHVGANVLILDVAAQDGVTHRRYSILVERAPAQRELLPHDPAERPGEHAHRRPPGAVDGAPVTDASLAVRRMVLHAIGVADGRGVIEQPSQRDRAPSVFAARVSAEVRAVNILLELNGGVRAAETLSANGLSMHDFAQQAWPLQPGENVVQILVSSLDAVHEPQTFALVLTRDVTPDADGDAEAHAVPTEAVVVEDGLEAAVPHHIGRRRAHALPASTAPGLGAASGAWKPGDVIGLIAALCIAASAAYLALLNRTELRGWAARSLHLLQLPPDAHAARRPRFALSRRADRGGDDSDDSDGGGGGIFGSVELGARRYTPRKAMAAHGGRGGDARWPSTWTELPVRHAAPHGLPPAYAVAMDAARADAASGPTPAAAQAVVPRRRDSDDGLL